MTTKRRTILKSGVASLSVLAAPAIARAQAAPASTLIWADDSNSDVTYDPRVTQSRHEEQVIVQIFDQLIMSDENGTSSPPEPPRWRLPAWYRNDASARPHVDENPVVYAS